MTSTTGSWKQALKATMWRLLQFCLFVIVAPPLLNFASIKRESSLLSEHGLPYDVGFNQKLFLRCRGKGVPTVILDSPTGFGSDVWLPLQDQLKEITTVCVYDRSGIGMSELPTSIPKDNAQKEAEQQTNKVPKMGRGMEFTIERMAEDLHRLITFSSHQNKPFILVGTELSGLIARFYAQIYELYNKLIPHFHILQLAAATGINRLLLISGMMETPLKNTMNDSIIYRQRHLLCNPRHIGSAIREHFYMNETFSQMKLAWRMKAFPQNISVTIVTKRKYDTHLSDSLNKAWDQSQQYLRENLFRNRVQHITLDSNDKYFMFNKPSLLFSSISDAIHEWRSKGLA
ncbi:unnamed protein product [Didymodactylos carnosus]|uniref:AB hydrolase-1 domain-containing protein n=1 Tax=Didymodactylos carnosus TaxID=1234261 RepID=A0A814UUC8_9BILA|nr:unnamed protein product [Didymodactylos carnosus]CAF1178606.1 unnamed protein product [Didymodactylos carnosus]CAF3557471.1 unnamed protein product [Didymodactylos carnosus]CAF3942811.1 unnamed protein product [Didymodactylos carnosus]